MIASIVHVVQMVRRRQWLKAAAFLALMVGSGVGVVLISSRC
jgi:hypothetical protein